MEKEDRRDYWVYEDGDVTIEFPDKNKKAKKFNEVVENKKGDEDDEKQ